jgi:hypothetical protein
MATIPQPLLFTWKEIEDLGDLSRLKLLLDNLPDEDLMLALESARGNGRDDYPVRAVWNSLLAGIVFQHPSIESLRRELSRNAQLRQLCGFDPARADKQVPPSSVYTRFLNSLLNHAEEVDKVFSRLLWQTSAELPDLGQFQAIDGKAVASHARRSGRCDDNDRRGDHDANWGVKSYTVNRTDGSTERQTKRWFGFKVHTIVDTTYELPLAYEVTPASTAEQPVAIELIKQLKDNQPLILETGEYFMADRGYDDSKLHRQLWDHYQIKPVIGIRNLWQQPEGHDATCAVTGLKGVAYDFEGNVYCYNTYGHRQKMAHAGFEKDRDTIKYRCPAQHYGLHCSGASQCSIGKSVRIPIEEDRRVFGPVARDSYKWKDLYKQRTAAERVYSRMDGSFGFENHTIRGLKKMKLRVGMAYMAMLAMALGRIKENKAEQMRSLVAQAAG